MEKYPNADPFKYILYSANIAEATPLLSVRPTAKGLKEEMPVAKIIGFHLQ